MTASAATAPLVSALSPELQKLRAHLTSYFSGMLGTMALGLVSFPIFTRVFTVSEYGTIDLVLKLLLLLTAASKMGLQNGALRFFDAARAASDPAWTRRYYSTMLCGAVITSLCIAVPLLPFAGYVPASWVGPGFASLAGLVFLLVVVRALQSVLYAFLRVEQRTAAFNIATVGLKAATIALICAQLLWLAPTASVYFTGLLVADFTVAAVLITRLACQGVLHVSAFDLNLFRTGVTFGLPLVVYECAFSLLGSADRLLVRHYLGGDALGIYSVAYGLSSTANDFLITPLNLALMPIYLRLWNAEGHVQTSRFLSSSLDWYLLVSIGVFAAAAAIANDLVFVLASSKYAASGSLIPLLLAGLLIYTTHVFFGAGLFLQNQTMRMAAILLQGAAVNIGLNIWLLPRFGLLGGAAATFVSYGFCILRLALASQSCLALRVDLRMVARCAAAGCAAWGLASMCDFDSHLAELAARLSVVSVVYLLLLLAFEERLRRSSASAWRMFLDLLKTSRAV